jgi:hypothetical protein
MQDSVSVGANAVSANVIAGQLYEFVPNGTHIQLAVSGSATGLRCTLVCNIPVLNDQAINLTNRFPVIPDDILFNGRVRACRLVLTARNTTAGALYDLARVVGQSKTEAGDEEMDVVSFYTPVIELFAPMDGPQKTTSTDVMNRSFEVHPTISVQAGSGAVSVLVATLSAGRWKFNCQGSMWSNYIPTISVLDQGNINLTYGNGTINLLQFAPSGSSANPIAVAIARTVDLLLPVDGVQIRTFAQNNAALQNMVIQFNVSCLKIL